MGKHKIITVVGARPQFIKAAAISKVLVESDELEEVIVHTGQHYDENMSRIFFEELGIPREKYNLNVGSSSQTKMTAEMMLYLEEIFVKEEPAGVLLYGDTNSTLAAALVAGKMHIPVFHVEAGVRSKRKNRPEEINRLVTDNISSILFPPTKAAENHLENEGIRHDSKLQKNSNNPIVINVGDVMYDNYINFSPIVESSQQKLKEFGVEKGNYVLVTIHRPMNTDNDENFRIIMESINELSKKYEIDFVFPIHPRTKKVLDQEKFTDIRAKFHSNQFVKITEPVAFLDMLILQRYCKMAFTDSGGVQKETAFANNPSVVLINTTAWKELSEAGIIKETKIDRGEINKAFDFYYNNKIGKTPAIFGDGKSSEKMVRTIIDFLNEYSKIKDGIKFQ